MKVRQMAFYAISGRKSEIVSVRSSVFYGMVNGSDRRNYGISSSTAIGCGSSNGLWF